MRPDTGFLVPAYSFISAGSINLTMHSNVREVIGFLSRWCLLALVAAAVLTGAWAGALATAAVNQDRGAALVTSDAILQQAKWARVTGSISPCSMGYENALLLCNVRGRLPVTAGTGKGRLYADVDCPSVGLTPVTIVGTPYGALAFEKRESLLSVVEPGRTVFMLDARLVLSVKGGDAETLRECVHEMKKLGGVGFFHPGPAAEFVQARRDIRARYPRLPVVCMVKDTPDSLAILRVVGRGVGARDRLRVITDDARLADGAVCQRFPVRWIGSGRKQPRRVPAEDRYKTLETLKASLCLASSGKNDKKDQKTLPTSRCLSR
ncbi:MAG: hypothetical protein SVT52_01890 [Planctomycetota bacterium]|nr:hypothetical protein [Planctomycetota bacterium]